MVGRLAQAATASQRRLAANFLSCWRIVDLMAGNWLFARHNQRAHTQLIRQKNISAKTGSKV